MPADGRMDGCCGTLLVKKIAAPTVSNPTSVEPQIMFKGKNKNKCNPELEIKGISNDLNGRGHETAQKVE